MEIKIDSFVSMDKSELVMCEWAYLNLIQVMNAI